jgi:hypothetical protein
VPAIYTGLGLRKRPRTVDDCQQKVKKDNRVEKEPSRNREFKSTSNLAVVNVKLLVLFFAANGR